MNRLERINTTIAGGKPDRVPVGMWFHFDPSLSAQQAADAHFDFVKAVDLDVIKIMYDNGFILDTKIEKASDWYKINPKGTGCDCYQKQLDILKRLVDKGAGEYPVWMTMFGAFKLAVMAAGDATVMAHSKEDPDAVYAGVSAIAQTLCEWAQGYLSSGADAILYSAQFGEKGRFTKAEWEKLVKPNDLTVLNVAESTQGKYNVLHLCGEPEYDYLVNIDWFEDYPGAIVNWAVYPNKFDIAHGKELFKRPILGGLNNHGVMAHGSDAEVAQNVKALLDEYGTAGYMVGADCSIESKECLGRIKAAVDAAKAYGA